MQQGFATDLTENHFVTNKCMNGIPINNYNKLQQDYEKLKHSSSTLLKQTDGWCEEKKITFYGIPPPSKVTRRNAVCFYLWGFL